MTSPCLNETLGQINVFCLSVGLQPFQILDNCRVDEVSPRLRPTEASKACPATFRVEILPPEAGLAGFPGHFVHRLSADPRSSLGILAVGVALCSLNGLALATVRRMSRTGCPAYPFQTAVAVGDLATVLVGGLFLLSSEVLHLDKSSHNCYSELWRLLSHLPFVAVAGMMLGSLHLQILTCLDRWGALEDPVGYLVRNHKAQARKSWLVSYATALLLSIALARPGIEQNSPSMAARDFSRNFLDDVICSDVRTAALFYERPLERVYSRYNRSDRYIGIQWHDWHTSRTCKPSYQTAGTGLFALLGLGANVVLVWSSCGLLRAFRRSKAERLLPIGDGASRRKEVRERTLTLAVLGEAGLQLSQVTMVLLGQVFWSAALMGDSGAQTWGAAADMITYAVVCAQLVASLVFPALLSGEYRKHLGGIFGLQRKARFRVAKQPYSVVCDQKL